MIKILFKLSLFIAFAINSHLSIAQLYELDCLELTVVQPDFSKNCSDIQSRTGTIKTSIRYKGANAFPPFADRELVFYELDGVSLFGGGLAFIQLPTTTYSFGRLQPGSHTLIVTTLSGFSKTYDFIINGEATDPIVSYENGNSTICSGTKTTLSADEVTGTTLNWYNANQEFIGTGKSFITEELTAATTYYAKRENGCISSQLVPVMVDVKTCPTLSNCTNLELTNFTGSNSQTDNLIVTFPLGSVQNGETVYYKFTDEKGNLMTYYEHFLAPSNLDLSDDVSIRFRPAVTTIYSFPCQAKLNVQFAVGSSVLTNSSVLAYSKACPVKFNFRTASFSITQPVCPDDIGSVSISGSPLSSSSDTWLYTDNNLELRLNKDLTESNILLKATPITLNATYPLNQGDHSQFLAYQFVTGNVDTDGICIFRNDSYIKSPNFPLTKPLVKEQTYYQNCSNNQSVEALGNGPIRWVNEANEVVSETAILVLPHVIGTQKYYAQSYVPDNPGCGIILSDPITVIDLCTELSTCNLTLQSMNEAIYYNPVPGGTLYQMQIEGEMYINGIKTYSTKTINSAQAFFRLTWLPVTQGAFLCGENYSVKVRVLEINNVSVNQNFRSDACTLITPLLSVQAKQLLNARCDKDNGYIEVETTGGYVSADPFGGSFPFTTSWTSPNMTIAPSNLFPTNPFKIKNLPAGDYNFVVSDFNGCNAVSELFHIDQLGKPKILSTTSAITCVGGTASVSAVVTPGATVKWYRMNGTFVSSDNPLVVSNVTTSTTYKAIASTADGCESSVKQATISVNCTQIQPAFCNSTKGLSDGIYCERVTNASAYRFEITAVDGTKYYLTNNSADFAPSDRNFFRFVWRVDAAGNGQLNCGETYQVSAAARVNNQWQNYGPACPITIAQTNVTHTVLNPSCDYKNDGSITLNVTGGSGSYTYNWKWNDNGEQTASYQGGATFTRTFLKSIPYEITVRDNYNTSSCATVVNISLSPQNATPVFVNGSIDRSICSGISNSMFAQFNIGSISWYTGASNSTAVATGTSLTTPVLYHLEPQDVAPGAYLKNTVEYRAIANNNGCLSQPHSVKVYVYECTEVTPDFCNNGSQLESMLDQIDLNPVQGATGYRLEIRDVNGNFIGITSRESVDPWLRLSWFGEAGTLPYSERRLNCNTDYRIRAGSTDNAYPFTASTIWSPPGLTPACVIHTPNTQLSAQITIPPTVNDPSTTVQLSLSEPSGRPPFYVWVDESNNASFTTFGSTEVFGADAAGKTYIVFAVDICETNTQTVVIPVGPAGMVIQEPENQIFNKGDNLGTNRMFTLEDETFKLLLEPNPTDGILKVSVIGTPQSKNQIQLRDLTGKILFETETEASELTLNLDSFRAGSYFLQVVQQGKSITKPLVVIH